MTRKIPIMNGSGGYAGSVPILTEETKAEAVALVESGLSRSEVARRIGVAPSTVSRLAAAAGLGFAGSAQTDAATQARIYQLRERRIDAAEQIHLSLEQALALVMVRMATRPDDARGIADSSRAVRDLAARVWRDPACT